MEQSDITHLSEVIASECNERSNPVLRDCFAQSARNDKLPTLLQPWSSGISASRFAIYM